MSKDKVVAALLVLLALASAGRSAREVARLTPIAPDAVTYYVQAYGASKGEDAKDPAVSRLLEAELGVKSGPIDTGPVAHPYPPTTALLFLPAAALTLEQFVTVHRWINWLAIGAIGAFAGAAAVGRSRREVVVASAALGVAFVYALRVSSTAIRVGQVVPVVACCCAVALWALSRERWRLAGAAVGLGAAVKVFPVVMLVSPLTQRRYVVAAVAAALVGALALVAAVNAGGLYAGDLAATVLGWAGHAQLPPFWDQRTPPTTRWAWHLRHVVLGPLTLGLVVWAARRPRPELLEPLAVLVLAWCATVMAGGPMYHTAMLVVPAFAWAVARGLRGGLGPRAAGWVLAWALFALWTRIALPGRPADLHWVPVGWVVWMVPAWECVRLLRARGVTLSS